MSFTTVSAYVTTLCSAYDDGAELVHQIKTKRKARKAYQQDFSSLDPSTNELELSLSRGKEVIRAQYDQDAKRFGAACMTGDQTARDALQDIIIYLQSRVISTLKVQWQQDIEADFNALQDVSDQCQDSAILVLMQLAQRIVSSVRIEPPIDPPPSLQNPVSNQPPEPAARPTPSTDGSDTLFVTSSASRSTASLPQPRPIDSGPEKKSHHFTSVAKIAFFRRPKAELRKGI